MIKNICCIGAGFVGGPTMSVMADRCRDILFKVVDINQERINAWNSNDLEKLPVFEPGLSEIIKRVRNKNLFFTTNINESIKDADMIFISVNTPIKKTGLGAGQASDLSWVESSTRTIASQSRGHTIVVEKSTLPVKTARVIKNILEAAIEKDSLNTRTFTVLSNPEFLAEGTAINDLENPDRVLIGGEDEYSINKLKNLYLNWVPTERIISTNLWSSELSKLTANAFLAQRISSINSVSAICEATGADVREVANSIGRDSRIGEKFIEAGPGFGGSCFKKDILNLVYLCRGFNLNEVADYWEQVIKINNWQKERIYKIIVDKLFGNIADKKILILGFAFKSNTNDTRESPSIYISKDLINERANIFFHDPKVTKEQIFSSLENVLNSPEELKYLNYSEDVYDASRHADAIIILTEWDEYKNLNWSIISKNMRKPAWLFDTRGIIKSSEVKDSGINFWQLGK